MPADAAPSHPLTTRFAPSPTGHLHLGHVAHAAWVWGVAGALGARVLLRMEDHDRGRCKPEYEASILEDLAWLGFVPDPDGSLPADPADAAPRPSAFRQSDCEAEYQSALAGLAAQGLVYGCACSRSTIAAELGDGVVEGEELRYPGLCRDRGLPLDGHGVRLRLPDDAIRFDDVRLGARQQQPSAQCGDLLVRDRAGQWTYQFAVTVDDLRHGVDLVIRGEDLLGSTGRQILLGSMLGRGEPARFLHHPLIRGADGSKLAKRNRDAMLGVLRASGHAPDTIIGRALQATGVLATDRAVRADEVPELFRQPVRAWRWPGGREPGSAPG